MCHIVNSSHFHLNNYFFFTFFASWIKFSRKQNFLLEKILQKYITYFLYLLKLNSSFLKSLTKKFSCNYSLLIVIAFPNQDQFNQLTSRFFQFFTTFFLLLTHPKNVIVWCCHYRCHRRVDVYVNHLEFLDLDMLYPFRHQRPSFVCQISFNLFSFFLFYLF